MENPGFFGHEPGIPKTRPVTCPSGVLFLVFLVYFFREMCDFFEKYFWKKPKRPGYFLLSLPSLYTVKTSRFVRSPCLTSIFEKRALPSAWGRRPPGSSDSSRQWQDKVMKALNRCDVAGVRTICREDSFCLQKIATLRKFQNLKIIMQMGRPLPDGD